MVGSTLFGERRTKLRGRPQVLLQAKAGQVQDAVSAALGVRDGQNCADAVAKAATQLMSQRDADAVRRPHRERGPPPRRHPTGRPRGEKGYPAP